MASFERYLNLTTFTIALKVSYLSLLRSIRLVQLIALLFFSVQVNGQNNVYVSDASGSNTAGCGSQGSPCQTIQYAVDNIAADGDTIKIDTGLYQLASSVNQYTPVVLIPEDMSLSFVGTDSGLGTRIDGDTTRRGFLYLYAGTSCPSSDTNNEVMDTLDFYFQDIIIQNCHIVETCGNTTYAYGGGMRLDCDSSSVMNVNIDRCIFRNNRSYDISGPNIGARSASGGAIYIFGRRFSGYTNPALYAQAHITNCDFSGNYCNQISNGGHGGAILLRDLDTASVTNSSFCDNYVYSQNADNGDLQRDRNAGGALCIYDRTNSNPGKKYHVDACTFINNQATVAGNLNFPSEGGAIFLTRGDNLNSTTTATIHLSNTDFYNNNVEAGIEHYDKNSGTIDTSGIGFNAYYSQFEIDLGDDTTICDGDTLLLDATITGGEYAWMDGSTTATYAVVVGDTYMVTVTVGSCEVSDTIVVDVAIPPVVDLGPDTTICPDDTILLDAFTSGASYTWNTGSNDSVISVSSAGSYWVEAEISGCVGTDTIQVDTVSISPVDLGNDTILCDNAVLNLNVFQSGATYAWQDGSTLSTFLVTTAGTYMVTMSEASCSFDDQIVIDYGETPEVDLGVDQIVCPYDSVNLDVSTPNATYLWNNGDTTSTQLITSQGIYWVAVDSFGCVGSDTISIDTIELAPVNLGPDTQLCGAETMVLNAFQSGASFLWSTGETQQAITVTSAAIYSVTVSKSGCDYEDDIIVTYQAYPIVDLGEDQTICPYDNIALDATNAGAQYLWNTGETSASIVVSDEDEFTVAVNLNGCWAFDTILIDTIVIPASYLGNGQLLCPGDVFTLDATTNNASAYLWNDGSTQSTYTNDEQGVYWVQVTVDFCEVTDSVFIDYVEEPTDIIGGDVSICEGQDITLAIGPGGLSNYLWSTGSSQPSITVSAAGQYWASVTKQGCPFSDTLDLSIKPLPNIPFGEDRELCDGDSVFLDATNPNALYAWNNGYDGPSKVVTKTGTYSVSVYMNGCYADESITLTFKPNPVPELGEDVSKCESYTHTFNAYRKMFDSYSWSNGSNDSAITVSQAGVYGVTVSMDGCFGSDSAAMNINALPEVDLGPDTIICEGFEHELNAEVSGDVLYQWHDGSEEPTFNVWRPGIYSVRADRGGCVAKDTIEIAYHPLPNLNLGSDTTICIGDSLLLTSYDSNSTFTWNGSEVKRSQLVIDSSYVWVIGENICGQVYDSILVEVRDCECFMYIPKAFTPDADDINESFKPQFDCDVTKYSFVIYNRWGERIFETDNPNKGWDGTRNGHPLGIGAFIYEINYRAQLEHNGSEVSFHKMGTVTLLK